MKKISIYRTLILALLIFTVIGLKLKVTEPVILLLTLAPFLTALLLSLSSGFSTQPARIVAFTLPSLLFFFFAFYPWLVRREETVASSSTSVLDFIHFPITACIIGFASLALFEIFTTIVSEEAERQ